MRPPPRFNAWKAAWVAAPLMVVVALVGLVHPPQIRLKGSTPFQVFYKRTGDPKPWVPGIHFRPGDALRFAYSASSPGYLMIMDVDDEGHVQVVYPYGAREAAAVFMQDNPLLPGSIALDQSQGPEFFLAVFRPKPFTVDSVASGLVASRSSTPRLVCPGCLVETIQIEKEP